MSLNILSRFTDATKTIVPSITNTLVSSDKFGTVSLAVSNAVSALNTGYEVVANKAGNALFNNINGLPPITAPAATGSQFVAPLGIDGKPMTLAAFDGPTVSAAFDSASTAISEFSTTGLSKLAVAFNDPKISEIQSAFTAGIPSLGSIGQALTAVGFNDPKISAIASAFNAGIPPLGSNGLPMLPVPLTDIFTRLRDFGTAQTVAANAEAEAVALNKQEVDALNQQAAADKQVANADAEAIALNQQEQDALNQQEADDTRLDAEQAHPVDPSDAEAAALNQQERDAIQIDSADAEAVALNQGEVDALDQNQREVADAEAVALNQQEQDALNQQEADDLQIAAEQAQPVDPTDTLNQQEVDALNQAEANDLQVAVDDANPVDAEAAALNQQEQDILNQQQVEAADAEAVALNQQEVDALNQAEADDLQVAVDDANPVEADAAAQYQGEVDALAADKETADIEANAAALNQGEVNALGSAAAGTALAQKQVTLATQRLSNATSGDWRVRLSLAPQANYLYKVAPAGTILAPLKNTDGVIFPYTPSITTSYKADYDPYTLTHSNFKGYFYKSSSVEPVEIKATFTAQDTAEANYLLAVIHFFRSVTKMFYGQDANRGAPPPLVYLSGLGQYQFNKHPCVVASFNYALPADVNYIRSSATFNTNGTNMLTQRESTSTPTNSLSYTIERLKNLGIPKGAQSLRPPSPQLGQDTPSTYVPTKMEIGITLYPMQSRKDVSQIFSVAEFANGNLLKGGFW